MKNFKNYLTEEAQDGHVAHVVWDSPTDGLAKLVVPAEKFQKNPDQTAFDILKKKIWNAKALIGMSVDKTPITHTDFRGTRKYLRVDVRFRTKALEEQSDSVPTNVEKAKERHDREKEQLTRKQELEKQRAREADFRAKEAKRKLEMQRKEAERRNKQVNEYLEDGTDELVAAYKKDTPGQT